MTAKSFLSSCIVFLHSQMYEGFFFKCKGKEDGTEIDLEKTRKTKKKLKAR